MKKVISWFQSLIDSSTGKAIVSVADSILDTKLDAVLQDLHDSDPEGYKATVAGLHYAFLKLAPLAAKTATTIDDAIIADWSNLVTASATKNGITL